MGTRTTALPLVTGLDEILGHDADGRTARASSLLLRRGASTVVITGDSITQQLGYTDRVDRQTDISWAAWCNALLGGRFVFLNNAAVGGTSSDTMLANMPSKVIAFDPDWCWMLIGTNDVHGVGSDATVHADFKSNVLASIDLCQAAGIKVMIGTIPPTSPGNPSWSTTRVRRVHVLNAWIRDLPTLRQGVVVCDFFADFCNPTNADSSAGTGYLQADDGIHPGHLGARVMGQTAANTLQHLTPILPCLVSQITDRYNYSTGGNQLAPNPLLQSTGGTNNTSGVVTGTLPGLGCFISTPTGTWSAASAASSIAARSDGFGNDWVMTFTASGSTYENYITQGMTISNSIVSPGDTLHATCSLQVSGLANWMGTGFYVDALESGSISHQGTALERSFSDNTGTLLVSRFSQSDATLTLRTGPITVPAAGFSSLQVLLRTRFLGTGGTAVIKWGRVACWRTPA